MFSSQLIADLAPFHLLKHPFYQAWMEGTLPQSMLQSYAVQYYPHVDSFPRYVSAVHSKCEDRDTRRALAHNLADEEGLLGETHHPELWLRFAEGLGVAREEVKNAVIKPKAAELAATFMNFAKSSYAEGLGSLFAYEYQIPEISDLKIEGLKAQYQIHDEKTLQFFKVHSVADIYHSDACKKALDQLDEASQANARKAALQSAESLWNFLTEAYEPA